jgi:hypothetical protein
MADDPNDAKRCPECKSTNIRLESTREIRTKQPRPDGTTPVVAKTLEVPLPALQGVVVDPPPRDRVNAFTVPGGTRRRP